MKDDTVGSLLVRPSSQAILGPNEHLPGPVHQRPCRDDNFFVQAFMEDFDYHMETNQPKCDYLRETIKKKCDLIRRPSRRSVTIFREDHREGVCSKLDR